jgi:hypothetical protein
MPSQIRDNLETSRGSSKIFIELRDRVAFLPEKPRPSFLPASAETACRIRHPARGASLTDWGMVGCECLPNIADPMLEFGARRAPTKPRVLHGGESLTSHEFRTLAVIEFMPPRDRTSLTLRSTASEDRRRRILSEQSIRIPRPEGRYTQRQKQKDHESLKETIEGSKSRRIQRLESQEKSKGRRI